MTAPDIRAADMPPPASRPEPAGTRHFPCSSCGADLAFAPGQTQLACPHCGHVQQIHHAPGPDIRRSLQELDYHAALAHHLPQGTEQEVRVTRCPGCGAEVTLDENIHADRCPFCDTPVVAGTGHHRLIKPQAVLPFVLTEDQARGEMVKWLGRLWFAPSGLQQYARKNRRLSGLYVPFFTFDAATRSAYRGQRGVYYTEMHQVTVMVDGRPQTRTQPVQKIRWTPVSGQVGRRFDDVLVMASTGLPRRYADELTPWNLTSLRPYQAEWLAGFRAESYTVELPEAHAIARRTMDQVIENDIRRDIGGNVQRIEAVRTEAGDETFKHILLPVWMAAYRFRGRAYTFLVNGQTGEVQGERPYSVWKITFAVVLAMLLIGLLFGLSEGDFGISGGDFRLR